jgi:hypothetical protein
MSDFVTELWAVQGNLARGPDALLKIMNKLIAKAVAGQDQAEAFLKGDLSGVPTAELAEMQTVLALSHLDCSQTVRRLWDVILAEYRQGRGDEHHASLYLETLENVMRTLSISRDTLAILERLGLPLPVAGQIDRDLAELREFSLQVARNWVEFGQRDIDEARAELACGQCQDLDEAFAEIAGVSAEQWREKVRRRKEAKGG